MGVGTLNPKPQQESRSLVDSATTRAGLRRAAAMKASLSSSEQYFIWGYYGTHYGLGFRGLGLFGDTMVPNIE